MLILKYADWVLSHQVVDGESMYSQVGLTGVTGEFIQSIFIPEKRSVLPNWLQLLAEEQGREFGLPEGEVIGQKIGEFELLGTYSKQHRSGYLYVFDRAAIHHIVKSGKSSVRLTVLLGGAVFLLAEPRRLHSGNGNANKPFFHLQSKPSLKLRTPSSFVSQIDISD